MAELTSDLLEAARHGQRSAVVELLAVYYPIVWRMAAGLTGRDDVGRGVTRFLMQRSLRTLSNWKDERAPTRWFHHHTLLTTRRTHKHPPDAAHDTLLADHASDTHYVAFIRALRSLPMQQREAFILTHGERLDVRAIAVAMDCSVLAAGNHLREGTDRLRMLDTGNVDVHTMWLAKIYRSLGPDEDLAIHDIRKRVKRFYLPSMIGKILRRLIALALLAGAIWGGYWVWKIVEKSMDQ